MLAVQHHGVYLTNWRDRIMQEAQPCIQALPRVSLALRSCAACTAGTSLSTWLPKFTYCTQLCSTSKLFRPH